MKLMKDLLQTPWSSTSTTPANHIPEDSMDSLAEGIGWFNLLKKKKVRPFPSKI